MLAKLNTFALVGIEAVPVEVEVDNSHATLPKTIIVGLPELAVRESVHRIERALANLRYERPHGRTVVNLAPADLPKTAGAFDLPIALGMLVATGQVLPEQLKGCATVGELALDGSVRPIKGALSMAMAARAGGIGKLLVPAANAREAAVVEGVAVYGGAPSHRVIALSPQGRQLTQEIVEELAAEERLTLLSARFEGFDERIVAHLATDAISIGPYVLSNGDLPAMVLVDAIARRLPGALSEGSGELESFSAELGGGLEYPHYTRPAEFRGWRVPDVLLSGDHARIESWRREQIR